MDAFNDELQIKLRELQQLTDSATQSGINPRELLLEFVDSVTALANNFPDIYRITQDNDSGEPGEPIMAAPSKEAWENFPNFITGLRENDVHGVGIALVTLPEGHPSVGFLDEDRQVPLNGWRFVIDKHPKDPRYLAAKLLQEGAILRNQQSMFRLEPGVQFGRQPVPEDPLEETVRRFEAIALEGPFHSPIYATGKDVAIPEHRGEYNLPSTSVIFPLSGNQLDNTIGSVTGVHTPWMYTSEGFATPFALHSEDMNLLSLNVLHGGHPKVWTAIAPHHHDKFEQMILEHLGIKKTCDDVIRHQNLYVPRAVLDENEIHYCQFEQRVGQVVVTFPFTYHQGFNSGPNIAEAVNYAEKRWSPEDYRPCSIKACRHKGPTLDAFRMRVDGELQDAPVYDDPKENEAILEAPATEMPESSANKRPKRATNQAPAPSPPLPPRPSPRKRPTPSRQTTASASRRVPRDPTPVVGRSLEEIRLIVAKEAREKEARENEALVTQQKEFWSRWESNQRILTPQPKLQPVAIYDRLQSETVGARTHTRLLTPSEINTVTKLVAAWGSTDTFLFFKSLFPRLRDRVALVEAAPDTSVTGAAADVRALDSLGGSDAWNAIRHRYHLARFSQTYDQEVPVGNKKATIAFYKKVMASAYPHLSQRADPTNPGANPQEYQLKYESLSKSVIYGRYWKRIADRFGWGVLALLPSGGVYGISNSAFHALSKDVFDSFLETLTREKGDWLRSLDGAMAEYLKGAMTGSLPANTPQLLLEMAADQDIKKCADQSEDLARLISPAPSAG
jgi:hypothetical protein